jgi:hypothetical protein
MSAFGGTADRAQLLRARLNKIRHFLQSIFPASGAGKTMGRPVRGGFGPSRAVWTRPRGASAVTSATRCHQSESRKREYCAIQPMSALTPKADMCSATRDVRFVPKADMRRYSITSSAMARMPDGMAKPSALAVLRLMTSSNLTSWMIGRSPGFSPLRILPA